MPDLSHMNIRQNPAFGAEELGLEDVHHLSFGLCLSLEQLIESNMKHRAADILSSKVRSENNGEEHRQSEFLIQTELLEVILRNLGDVRTR